MLYSKTKIGDELEKATNEWGKMINESLEARFGKGKTGFCLILCTGGEGGSMHIKTNLRQEGLVAYFREIANKLAAGMRGYVIH